MTKCVLPILSLIALCSAHADQLGIPSTIVSRLPRSVQINLDEIECHQMVYPGRDEDISHLSYWANQGDFEMVAYKANQIVQKQNNLR
jgi:hypothetical protein